MSNVRLGVEYIAFYQSKKSFGDSAGIHYYGKIKETKRYKRKECTEVPKGRISNSPILARTLSNKYLKEQGFITLTEKYLSLGNSY